MDRCPNCGSSVRIGAKFCTTCGFRLPTEAPAAAPSTPTRSPFDTTSTASVASRWPTPEPVKPVVEAAPPVDTPSSIEIEPPTPQTSELIPPAADAVAADPATFAGWPSYGTQSGWPEDPLSVPEMPHVADVSGESDVQSVEDAIHAWTGVPAAAAEMANEAQEQVSAEAAPDSLDWFNAIEPENKAVDTEADAAVTESAEGNHVDEYKEFLDHVEQESSSDGVELTDESQPVEPAPADPIQEIQEAPGAVETAAAVAATSGTVAAGTANGDPVARATQLVDELKSLLPQLGGAGAASSVDVSGIAAELQAARQTSEEEKASMQSLRAAIATAQARPRDVDVMLDLVSRSGEIAALFMTHDAYAEAIDRAIGKLKGETEAEPEPRW